MDRNSDGVVSGSGDYVALRKESVDRNLQNCCPYLSSLTSLSVRRAWIEICNNIIIVVVIVSLSVRRAWIEICKSWQKQSNHQSLSVRRAWIEIEARKGQSSRAGSRSP